jgi:DsbC/DsbD-like thiol-disulfide interchange protein
MPKPPARSVRPAFATICLALSCFALPAAAADTSAWDGDSRSAVRLLAARPDGSMLRGGIEINMAPGWKTYWRYPGDAGVPPHFDFSESENLGHVDVLWPAPIRFADAEGNTIGYKGDVVLPLRVEPTDRSRAVVLRLKLDYAVCEKLCVPAQAKVELPLPGDASAASEAAVAEAEKRVPRPVALGARQPLAIASVRHEKGSAKVSVDVAAPAGTEPSLFVEGPAPDWALPLPEPAAGAPQGQKRFVFALEGLPPGARTEGAVLKFTAAAADQVIETTFRLE